MRRGPTPLPPRLRRRAALHGPPAPSGRCWHLGRGAELVTGDEDRRPAWSARHWNDRAAVGHGGGVEHGAASAAGTSASRGASDVGALLDAVAARLVTEGSGPGVALVAVGSWGTRIVTRGAASVEHGTPLTPSTPMYAASLAKIVTAVAVHRCVAAGLLRLDDTLTRWFPDLAAPRGSRSATCCSTGRACPSTTPCACSPGTRWRTSSRPRTSSAWSRACTCGSSRVLGSPTTTPTTPFSPTWSPTCRAAVAGGGTPLGARPRGCDRRRVPAVADVAAARDGRLLHRRARRTLGSRHARVCVARGRRLVGESGGPRRPGGRPARRTRRR